MKKVSVIGHFAEGFEYLDGQTIKTKIITNGLCRLFGAENVLRFDTHGSIKTLVKSPLYVLNSLWKSKNVVMLPAHNGLRIFGLLLPFFRIFFKGRKIHYVVIGGWLPEILQSKKYLASALKKFDGIYVETNTMRNALLEQGYHNIHIMPNCKELASVSDDELIYHNEVPYKLCTFSRVMKEKGIEDAVKAITSVNDKFKKQIFTLDIYGQVDSNQTEWFDTLKTSFPEYVNYCGSVPFDKSVEVLKNYFALLFPTRFYTEGIPGTIIDAYAAGVPVISSKWQSFEDVIDEGVTGIGYKFGDADDLTQKLIDVEKSAKQINNMKLNCLKKSKTFLPDNAIEGIVKNFV